MPTFLKPAVNRRVGGLEAPVHVSPRHSHVNRRVGGIEATASGTAAKVVVNRRVGGLEDRK